MAVKGLTTEIRLAVVWLEECSDRSISIECDEGAARAIISRNGAVAASDFLDISSHGSITEELRQAEIFLLGDLAELTSVLGVVLVELLSRVKSDLRATGLGCRPCSGARICFDGGRPPGYGKIGTHDCRPAIRALRRRAGSAAACEHGAQEAGDQQREHPATAPGDQRRYGGEKSRDRMREAHRGDQ